MISPDEALEMVLAVTARLPPRMIPLAETCGLRLAAPAAADRDYPPFSRAMMDGYAVRLADAGQSPRVVGEIAAGQVSSTILTDGTCLEIMTGAPCPDGTEAVVPKEEVQRQGDRILLPDQIAPRQHVAPQGSECRQGQVILEPGAVVTPLAIAALASFGQSVVCAIPRPSLAIITTGGELVSADGPPAAGQIRDSNGPMLVALAASMHLGDACRRHADDRLEAMLAALLEVSDRDLILLTGGVSVGTYDLVPEAVRRYGGEVVFHKVSQKPGKPLLLARRGDQLLFGLPGNPLACHFCFHRYVAAAARQMAGQPAEMRPMEGRLTDRVAGAQGRTFFATGRALPAPGQATGWLLEPVPGISSADIFTTCQADCFIEVPPGKAGLPAGASARFTWIGGRSGSG